MKTPEKLAEEWIETNGWNIEPFRDEYTIEFRKQGYVAGYQAAREHAHAALEEAEAEIDRLQTKLSDTGILTTEHLIDASKMVSSSETLNNWISVKDRLPERDLNILAWIKCGTSEYVFIETASGDPNMCSGWKHYNKDQVTHWMPLPKPPEE